MSFEALHRFLRLGKNDRQIVFLSAVGLVCARAGLRLVGFGRWEKAFNRFWPEPPREIPADRPIDRARHIARLHRAAERRLFFHPSCLEHSFVLQWQLRRERIASTLRFGGRKQDARFEAHAWVEVDGLPLERFAGESARFAPFETPRASTETQPR